MSELKDELEIYIITYNRAHELSITLENLLSSPVKDFSITVLDNASQDSTQNICNEFKLKFKNFRYIKNNRNLGPAGNILKAMELASKKWLWILGDDDNYNWDAWDEIKNALESDNYEIVNTCWHDGAKSNDPCVLLNEAGFTSTCIYKTKNITPIVMQNAYYLTLTWNPHSAIFLEVFNNGGKIYAPQQKLVIENMSKDYTKIIVPDVKLHPEIKAFNVVYITLKIYQLVLDKKLRYKCNEVICLGNDFRYSMNFMLKCGIDLRRLIDTFFMLSFKQRCVLISVIFQRLFFGCTKTETHRIYKLFGLTIIKIRRKKYKKSTK